MEAHTTEIVQELATEKTRLTGKNVRDYGTPSVNERKKDMERERVDCPAYSSYRRITHSSWHFPPAGKSWKEVFKRLLQLKFWPSSRSNAIHTNKYTILNFVPKNLFEQFHRFANIYFLFVLIINLIPAIGAYAKEITWIPLAFVLAVTAIKDGFEDVRRYYSDREINTRICQVFDRVQCKFINTKWKDVIVGDFVKLSCDEVIPADMLMLQTTNENDLCYIQTSNLDGETTLKSREAPVGILDHDDSNCDSFQHVHFTGQLFYEQPNKVIHEFKGFIQQESGDKVTLSKRNLLLRGCVLRNTDNVIGLVLYTGHETKAMLNNSGPRAKRSKLERDINIEIICQILMLLIMCSIGAIFNGFWINDRINRNIVYFPLTNSIVNPAWEAFLRFWTFIIIFQVIVPISLYITIEVVKTIQTFFMNWDLDMYHYPTDKPFECRALNINEDLGQIGHVFSDKTGTLTENEMIFRCCTISGTNYSHGLQNNTHEHGHVGYKHTGLRAPSGDISSLSKLKLDVDLHQALSDPSSCGTTLEDFFIAMAICNTVVVTHRTSTGIEQNGIEDKELFYEAESTDEYALVEAARCYGYVLLSRSPSLIKLKNPHQGIMEIQLLHVLEFTPDRKRMSVIVRFAGNIILYTKGADSVLYDRLRPDSQTTQRQTETQNYLDQYASLGLRTLCFTKKIISSTVYDSWFEDRRRSEMNPFNKEQLILESNDCIETDLLLLGATGIEDRLQDGVADTILALKEAGIKVWVLTGDKKETAVNVGYASNLLQPNFEIISLHARSEEDCLHTLARAHPESDTPICFTSTQSSYLSNTVKFMRNSWSKLQSFPPIMQASYDCNTPSTSSPKALVVDGQSLIFALSQNCSKQFLSLANECSTVICCRATPFQKAAVVQSVKDTGIVTLAIGDGANDVSMIQEANVGIGISGKEGLQAVLSSDFSMARFRYLKKLLLVHGHWCYSRLANMMLYFFYKNMTYVLLLFWFQLYNGFSGSNPVDGVNLLIYNLIYTSVPIGVTASIDQDLPPHVLLDKPDLYKQGRCSRIYTRWKFWLSIIEAIYQSLAIFFITYGTFYRSPIGMAEFGFVINIAAVLVVNLQLCIEILHWTIFHHLVMWTSCLLVFGFNYAYCALRIHQSILDVYYVLYMLSKDPRFWLVIMQALLVTMLPRIFCKFAKQNIFPNPVEKARQLKYVPPDASSSLLNGSARSAHASAT